MQVVKAQEIVEGLDAPQKKRLDNYRRQLLTGRDPRFFDKRVYTELLNYGKDLNRIIRTKSYLDSIGFTQSKYLPEMIDSALDKFTQPSHPKFIWNVHYKSAKALLIREFHSYNLRTIRYHSESEIVENLPRVDTHAGFCYILSGKKKKGEYVGGLYAMFVAEQKLARQQGSFNKPILIGSRCQASGAFTDEGEETGSFKSKTRLVSMIDLMQILAELMFAKPIQQHLATVPWYAGGKDDQAIHRIIYSKARESRAVLSLDYSSYDQTISDWLIDDAFDIIRAAFDNELGFDQELFNIVRSDFKNKVFLDGHGNYVHATKGVPSGSMFTQIVDSIVNRLMIITYMNSRHIQRYDMMIMGDDNLLMIKDEVVTKDEIASYITKNFGITCHPDKCAEYSYPERFEFLSRYWRTNGIWRTPEILIGKMLYPERFRDYRNNKDLNAFDIIQSYILSFKLGMQDIIDIDRFERNNVRLKETHSVRAKYMSGLERYRLLYL